MKRFSSILFAVLVWGLLMLRVGYRFGTGDHGEYLPYTLYLNDHSLYPHDYFLQGLVEKVPNERTLVCVFLSLFGSELEVACLIIHFLTTVLLVVGLQKLGETLTQNLFATRIAILVNFFLLFDRGLGNVEIYSDALQGGSICVAIIPWALQYFFNNRFFFSSVLMSAASIIHSVDGLTVYLVMASVVFYLAFFRNEIHKKQLLNFVLIYAITAGVFIAFLLINKFDGTSIASETFYRIYHEFRHAHHYVFAYLPGIEKLLFVLFIGTILSAASYNKKLFLFGVFALLGTMAYIICTDVLHLPQIANLQFFKVSQWIKFFAVLILVDSFFNWKYSEKLVNKLRAYLNWQISLTALAITLALVIIKPGFIERAGVYHQYGKDWETKDDMVDISLKVASQVERSAVFIQPFGFTALKYFGRVSSWVDWKAFVKDQSKIQEWYRRTGVVYGISIADKEKGFKLQKKADDYFYQFSNEKLEQLKREGVTHILIKKEFPPSKGRLILSNNTYAVYQL